MPKSIDFDRFEDPDEYVRMSDGVMVRREGVLQYSSNIEADKDDDERRHKIDAIVISSVAGMSAAALGLALYRLKKKHQET